MQIGLLIWIVGIIFAYLIAIPATWATTWVFRRLGMLPEDEPDFEKKGKKDRLFWSVFVYLCAVIFFIEQFLYSKVKYDQNDLLTTLGLISVVTVLIIFRLLMVINQGKLLPRLLSTLGWSILALWIGVIFITLIIGLGVLIFT